MYHSYLQRLGLKPARPFFPPWKSFVPFSQGSPLTPFSIHSAATTSISSFCLSIITSPFVLICLKHSYERWAYMSLSHTLETIIAHPDCPDIRSADHDKRDRATAYLGLRKPPRFLQYAVEKVIFFLGWGHPIPSQGAQECTMPQEDTNEVQPIDIGGTEVANLGDLALLPHIQDGSTSRRVITPAELMASLSDVSPSPRPHTPPSPTASQTSQSEDNDPRIRITSREGIVEMEVRLPQVLSQRTEVIETEPSNSTHRDDTSPDSLGEISPSKYHRVTQLSTEPSQMLAGICKAQIVNWMALPLQVIALHSVAAHYLATGGGSTDPGRVLHSFSRLGFGNLSWTSIGWQASRIALCASFDLAIDLAIWGGSCVAIVWTGTSDFGWGTL